MSGIIFGLRSNGIGASTCTMKGHITYQRKMLKAHDDIFGFRNNLKLTLEQYYVDEASCSDFMIEIIITKI